MDEQIPDTISYITVSDVSGIWEVIRISGKKENDIRYPWIGNRFKYNFLPEMIFLCSRDGDMTHGTWELSEKTIRGKKLYSIVLNESHEYLIVNFDGDEMILSDYRNEYLLIRRL